MKLVDINNWKKNYYKKISLTFKQLYLKTVFLITARKITKNISYVFA